MLRPGYDGVVQYVVLQPLLSTSPLTSVNKADGKNPVYRLTHTRVVSESYQHTKGELDREAVQRKAQSCVNIGGE